MLSGSSRTDQNVVLEQRDRSKSRSGVAEYVEMSSQSSRTGRTGVSEQQERSQCCLGSGQVEISSWSSRNHRNVV